MSIHIPERLIAEAKRRGIDVESIVIEALAKALNLDPHYEAEIRIEMAERFLAEGLNFLEKNDVVQACEKLYKAAEEAVKAAALALEMKDILEGVEARKRWTVIDLERVVRRLNSIVKGVREWWDTANYLHIWGFHEAKLDSEAVRERIDSIKAMVEAVKSIVKGSK